MRSCYLPQVCAPSGQGDNADPHAIAGNERRKSRIQCGGMDIDSVAGCGMSGCNPDAIDERQLPIADLAVKIPPKCTTQTSIQLQEIDKEDGMASRTMDIEEKKEAKHDSSASWEKEILS